MNTNYEFCNYSSEQEDPLELNKLLFSELTLLEHFLKEARTAILENQFSYADEMVAFAETIVKRDKELVD